MNTKSSPVIAIDGPSGAGKGTICRLLAKSLGYHYLDSGALYRLLGLAAKRHGIALDCEEDLEVLAGHIDVTFVTSTDGLRVKVILEGEDVSRDIRTEDAGTSASQIAAFPGVRQALLARQRAFAREPGLVADGRDMGTVVFQHASVKIFLTASQEVRAQRRYNELIDKGESVSLAALVEQVRDRDYRDANRDVSPLVPAENAIIIDTSDMNIDEVFAKVSTVVRQALATD